LDSLIDRLNALLSLVPHLAATIVFIQEGEHEVRGYEREPTEDEEDDDDVDLHEPYLRINYPMKIIGAGRNKTIIQSGGFCIKGKKEEGKNVVLQDFTMKRSRYNGM